MKIQANILFSNENPEYQIKYKFSQITIKR